MKFSRKILIFCLSILVLVAFIHAGSVFAQDSTEYKLLEPIPSFVGDSEGVTTANEYIPGVIRLIIALSGALAVIKIIFGGIQYMSTDSFSGKNQGRQTIQNALFGLILVISAWLILHTINPNLVEFDFSIEGQSLGEKYTSTPTGPPNVDPGDCINCTAVTVDHKGAFGVSKGCAPVGEDKTCKVNAVLNSRLVGLSKLLKSEENLTLFITEMFPPTTSAHKCHCHYDGTCVDAVAGIKGPTGIMSDVITGDQIKAFIDFSNDMKLNSVYEVLSEEEAERIREETGLSDSQVIYVPHATGRHFSVYQNSCSS